jgi:hypothetical protein
MFSVQRSMFDVASRPGPAATGECGAHPIFFEQSATERLKIPKERINFSMRLKKIL